MAFEQQLRVTVNFEQVFEGESFEIDELREKLKHFDSISVNTLLSKWGLFCSHKIGKSIQNHVALFSLFLDTDHKNKLIEIINDSQSSQKIIFNEFALLTLFKLNNERAEDGESVIEAPEDRLLFAKILLSMNSIIFKYIPANGTEELKEYVRFEQVKQFLSKGDGEPINVITRMDSLRERLEKFPRINELFKESTGLDIKTYYQLIFCLLPGWSVNHEPEKIDEQVWRDYRKYFSSLKFSDEIADRFIGSLSIQRSNFSHLNKSYTRKAMVQDNLWNYITFLNRPILEEKGIISCIDPNLLTLTMYEGVYNTLRTHIDERQIKDIDLPNIWGMVYEEYILMILKNAFGNDLTTHITINGQESIDAVVELHDTVLLIEIKYAHWRYKTRINPTRENIQQHLGKINRYRPWVDKKGRYKTSKKGFGQIKDFYINYKGGNLDNKFDFGDKQIIPVLIMGEMYPFDPISRELFEGYLEQEKCLIDYENHVLPFVLLSSSEVELAESLIENVSLNKFIELFRKFSYSFREKKPYFERTTTFLNVVHDSGYVFNNSKRMRKRLDEATRDIPSFFKKRL